MKRAIALIVLVFLVLTLPLSVQKVSAAPGYVTLRGYLTYLDDYGTQRPIRYATVNLYDRTWYGVDTLLGSVWTSSQGYYQFPSVENVDEFGGTGTLDLYIEVVVDCGAVKVVPVLPVNVWPYRWQSSVWWDISDGMQTLSMYGLGGPNAGAWGIYDSILNAYQQTEIGVGYQVPKITVVWPWPETYFQDLWVLQYIGISSGHEWDPDAVCHEYGHWVMNCLYTGNVPPVDYGSDGVHYWDSSETQETALVEGWAGFYSCAIRNDRYFWDSFDLESQLPTGDTVEGCVACILWDIYDSSDDGRDTLSAGFSPIWDVFANYVTSGHHASTIHEFWDGWFSRGHNNAQQMWAIFYDHGINKDPTPPSAPTISSSTHPDQNTWYSNNNPSFSWNSPPDLSEIAGFSYSLDQSPSTTPDTISEPLGNSKSYTDIADGEWWFHVRAKDNAGNWGPTAHYRIRIEMGTTMMLESSRNWFWQADTCVYESVVADVDNDGSVEIVTGGYCSDGFRSVAQLVVWSGSALAVENVRTWYWTDSTEIRSVAVGDVDADGSVEIITGGSYYDGTRGVAQLCVWDGATLALENVKTWYWTNWTQIFCLAVGDVDADGSVEIITGGYYFDGARSIAQLVVWSGSTLSPERVTAWYWTGTTYIYSVAVGDVDADGSVEIVTGGRYYDGTRDNAQLCVWSGSTLALERVRTWYWTGRTFINSVAIADVDGDSSAEIVTGGGYFDGTRYNAQLVVWSGSTLALERVTTWYWIGDTIIGPVVVGDVDSDGSAEIVTGAGYFDGTRWIAQLVVWSGSSLALENVTAWYWTGDTGICSVVAANVDGDSSVEIVTGGYYVDGYSNAQLVVWSNA